MNQEKIILVTGATGAQGGSVAKALLAQNEFVVRVFTRNARSEKAVALKNAGAEVVEGSLDDINSLQQAMNDCYGVFGVIDSRVHLEQAQVQGKNLIDAVKQSGIEHFVFISSPDHHRLSYGKYAVPHHDIKAALEQYTRSLGLPATFVQPAFYYENFLGFFGLQRVADGVFSFGFPQGDTRLAMASIDDLGPVVAAVFSHPVEYIGRTVGVVGANDTCTNYAALMSKVLGQKIYYSYVPRDIYAAYGFSGAQELANMFEVQRLYISNRQLDLIESYGLNPAMQSFASWLNKNVSKFEAGFAAKENKAA